MNTLESMDQRISSHCTLVSYSNLALVMITWNTTMKDLSQPMMKITTSGAVTIVLSMLVMVKEMDGGLALAVIVY